VGDVRLDTFSFIAISMITKNISPTLASVSMLIQKVFTAIFSVPVLGELLTFKELLGGMVMLFGIYLVNSHKMIF
jgi:drug/metabolite transporter (DMT)-like permease